MAKKVSTKKATEAKVEPSPILRPDVDLAIEKRLVALYTLQSVDSEIDKIQIIRGELPQAVQDLEDEIAGLNTRIDNFNSDIKETDAANKARNAEITDHQEQIKKYQKQQDNVRNNREYESLAKEIEFQNLEIQLCERKRAPPKSKNSKNISPPPNSSSTTAQKTSTPNATNSPLSSPKLKKTRNASAKNPKNKNSSSTSATSPPTSASAAPHATASPSSPSTATPAADASPTSPRSARWKSRCTKKLSSAKTAAAYSSTTTSPLKLKQTWKSKCVNALMC